MTGKNGGNSSGEGSRGDMERKLDGGAISTPAPMSGYDNHLDETVKVVDSRADVERVTDSPTHARIRN